jgi:hypothetical protein
VERFRLVADGPTGDGRLVRSLPTGQGGGAVSYKLFERVEGAVIRIPAEAGAWVQAELALETGTGRQYRFAARARAEEDAFARLRVPYSTQPVHPVRARGPYHLEVGEAECDLEVPDQAVRSGATLELAECGPHQAHDSRSGAWN